MPQMRTSIKIRAGYRPAARPDGDNRCRYCSRKAEDFAGPLLAPQKVFSCKLLGITINPDYTCREYKPKENQP